MLKAIFIGLPYKITNVSQITFKNINDNLILAQVSRLDELENDV